MSDPSQPTPMDDVIGAGPRLRANYEVHEGDGVVRIFVGHPCYCPAVDYHSEHEFHYTYLDHRGMMVGGHYYCSGTPTVFADRPANDPDNTFNRAKELMYEVMHSGWYIGPESGEAWDNLRVRIPARLLKDLIDAQGHADDHRSCKIIMAELSDHAYALAQRLPEKEQVAAARGNFTSITQEDT